MRFEIILYFNIWNHIILYCRFTLEVSQKSKLLKPRIWPQRDSLEPRSLKNMLWLQSCSFLALHALRFVFVWLLSLGKTTFLGFLAFIMLLPLTLHFVFVVLAPVGKNVFVLLWIWTNPKWLTDASGHIPIFSNFWISKMIRSRKIIFSYFILYF